MSNSHVIRIHAAWQRIELSDDLQELGQMRLALPDLSSVNSATCYLIYRRSFNLPTGLTSSDRVNLECELLKVADEITFNRQSVQAPIKTGIFDITSRLQTSNELRIQVPISAIDTVRVSSARLLIYCGSEFMPIAQF